MPPKSKNQKKKKAAKRALPKKAKKSNEITKLVSMMQKMNAPQNQVTDLGRMLLHGGNALGGLVGLPKIFGSGSYAIEQNVLWNPEQQVPFMHSDDQSITLRHREYIADISMNGAAFTIVQFAINPGLAATFPYLSGVADNFQEYSFTGLVFEYKTTSSASLSTGVNTAMGSVMLAVQYRSDAVAFTTKQQLLNEMWSVDIIPAENCVLPVECSPKENPFQIQYIRSGAATGDIKMFDLGLLSVATSGGQVGQTNIVGELWASYEVVLKKPQITTFTSGGPLDALFNSTSWTSATPFANMVPAVNSIGILFTSSNTFVIPLGTPAGYYLMTLGWQGTSVAFAEPAFTLSSNITFVGGSYTNSGTTTTVAFYQVVLLYTGVSIGVVTIFATGGVLPLYNGLGPATFQVLQLTNSVGWTTGTP